MSYHVSTAQHTNGQQAAIGVCECVPDDQHLAQAGVVIGWAIQWMVAATPPPAVTQTSTS
jgi:hypothetical protein